MSNSTAKELREEGIGYYQESRSFTFSIVSILPLVVAYHLGIVQSGHTERNMAETWLTGPLQLVGLEAAHVLNLLLVIAFIAVLVRSGQKRPFTPFVVVAMVGEAALYAALLYKGAPALAGMLDERASHVFFSMNFKAPASLLLALGAGVYEELVFRLLLLGGGALLLREVFRWSKAWSLGVALVVSSLLFAGAHHLGALGEPLESYSFCFRAVCGLLLGFVFLTRGIGIAVWTHAIYNALVMMQRIGAWSAGGG